MKDILSSTILTQAVFGLNDDAFMMFMVVFILLAWSICVGLAVVFRENTILRPVPEPAKASREVGGFRAVEVDTENAAMGSAVGCERLGMREEAVNGAFTQITNELSAVEQKTLPSADTLVP